MANYPEFPWSEYIENKIVFEIKRLMCWICCTDQEIKNAKDDFDRDFYQRRERDYMQQLSEYVQKAFYFKEVYPEHAEVLKTMIIRMLENDIPEIFREEDYDMSLVSTWMNQLKNGFKPLRASSNPYSFIQPADDKDTDTSPIKKMKAGPL